MAPGSIRLVHRLTIVWLMLACQPAGQAIAEPAPIDHFILALSWQPAFCQYHPELPECPPGGALPKSNPIHLTLHGLWPDHAEDSEFAYCGVSSDLRALDESQRWCEIPAPAIDESSQRNIAEIMPGAASCLDRHEWLKHGTCSGFDSETYFRLAAALAAQVGRSGLATIIGEATGEVIETVRLREAFEDRFGKGSARALSLRCRKDGGRSYLSAVWIRLSPRLTAIDSAEPSLERDLLDLRGRSGDRSCPRLIYIDAPGL